MTFLGISRNATPIALALVTAVVLAGCRADSSSSARNGPPASPGDCSDLGTHRGDGFVLAGSDWSGETHAYDEPATVYACVLASPGGTVRFELTGTGIAVTPARRHLTAYPNGIVPFQVKVSPGASGRLVMLQRGRVIATGGPGPTVVTEADGWHFTSSSQR